MGVYALVTVYLLILFCIAVLSIYYVEENVSRLNNTMYFLSKKIESIKQKIKDKWEKE